MLLSSLIFLAFIPDDRISWFHFRILLETEFIFKETWNTVKKEAQGRLHWNISYLMMNSFSFELLEFYLLVNFNFGDKLLIELTSFGKN